MTEYYDQGDSGEYRMLQRRPRKDLWGEWLTWVIRLLIPVICGLAYRQMLAMDDLQLTIAKMSVQQDYQTKQLADHQQQLQGLWQQMRQNGK